MSSANPAEPAPPAAVPAPGAARAGAAPDRAEGVADVAGGAEMEVPPRRRGGKRRPRVVGGRSEFLGVRYTVEELAAVTARAAACGWEVSSYVALAALRGAAESDPVGPGRAGGAFRMPPLERQAWAAELMAVRRIVGATANNVNQLARVANATGSVPAEVPASLAACERAMTRLVNLLDALEEAR